ncbi:MAG: LamG domain-containing protein [Deltaproteobacteria bacterium]|nr:LamG domain-containing protein [Deltaproteobacteria bacterium]
MKKIWTISVIMTGLLLIVISSIGYAQSGKKAGGAFLLNDKNSLVHVQFEAPFKQDTKVVELKPVQLSDTFTIEAVVKPAKTQSPYAGILGNHHAEGGFVIQQRDTEANTFYYGYHDGTNLQESVQVKLQADKWNYLVISQNKTKVTAYVNGKQVASGPVTGTFKNSALPLIVGNWINGDRPFTGTIREVKISNGNLTDKLIKASYDAILKKKLK